MERALHACDEITGLITAVALVRPSKSILDVKLRSIRKKWKDSHFAANVNREEIASAAEELGVDLWEHIQHVLTSMQAIASDLGLAGE
jgi:predicted hydrolase (HD superfamily)